MLFHLRPLASRFAWTIACATCACAGSSPNIDPVGSGGSNTSSNIAGSGAAGAAAAAGASVGGSAASGSSAGTAGSGGVVSGGASGASLGGDGNAGHDTAGAAGSITGGSGTGGSTAGGNGGAQSAACPAGPFPAPAVASSKSVCQSFTLDYTWNEGPTWVESQGAFFFSNFVAGSASGGNIIKYTPGGNCEVFIRDVGCNGLAASNDGTLLAACQQTRSVQRFDLKTKQATTVASNYMGMMLDTPNDVVQHSNGSIYFTNPTNELAGRPVGVGPAAFRVDPNGQVIRIKAGDCNGIGLSPDEKTLYVLLLGRWDLDAQGTPSNEQKMFSTGDGMAVDCAGNVYTNGSIFSPSGQSLGSWGTGTNLAFGGADHKTVLVTGPGKQLRELALNVPGLP